jgi:hypothetical protein
MDDDNSGMNKKHIDERGHHSTPKIEIIRTMQAVTSPFSIFNIKSKCSWQQMNREARKSLPKHADLCNPQMIDE